ncbi:MAG: family 14 glycosylhydrolase [Candidatus Hydrogenedentes bacterium]|nr:family 14 glycosylhydrolase [Candidatus Hydrogenedentota bacterium]
MRQCTGLLAAILFASTAFADPLASWSPGNEQGLRQILVPDGQWQRSVVEGREAVTQISGSSYLYFQLDPNLKAKTGETLFIYVEFLDTGYGISEFQYNSTSKPYEPGKQTIFTDSRTWAKDLISVANAKLAGLQNGGADFRIFRSGGLTLGRVEVYTENPGISVPSDVERMKQALSGKHRASRPSDMYYTFGGDPSEADGPLYRLLGATSVESYVTWETCERAGEGQWDWTQWDKQVKILQDNDLKWVPFLIVGPAYSTPNWFRSGKEHVPCRCLEHGTDSKIESLWNPNLPARIDRFLAAFAERYRDKGVIESVLLGIQGDFGEAIYSVTGGGWTFFIPGEYHNHQGFWCGDPYARADFQAYARKKYATLRRLNGVWGTDFQSWDTVSYPIEGERDMKAFRNSLADASPETRRHWLDFVDWYRASMTEFADWWMAATRRHFPDTPIYLCTGGDAPPEHGSNFAEQCRVAAKHDAGVRITNEGSDYTANFAITRWVAAAGRHYGAYFGFEPAGPEDERGVVARIYNATASGANQLHDYAANLVSRAPSIDVQQANLHHLFHVPNPVVPVAFWYPEVHMTLRWGRYFDKARTMRDIADYDYVDESMLRRGALDRYPVLVIAHGSVMETKDAKRIARWVRDGGRLIVMDVGEFRSVEKTRAPERHLFGKSREGRRLGKGSVVRVADWEALGKTLTAEFERLRLPVYPMTKDGVFVTQTDAISHLLLNTTDAEATVAIRAGEREHKVAVPAHGIARTSGTQ